jgi:hypothetical protein
MVRPYGHRTSSPPSRRLLARRPLDLGLGLRVQTLAADHRDTIRGDTELYFKRESRKRESVNGGPVNVTFDCPRPLVLVRM